MGDFRFWGQKEVFWGQKKFFMPVALLEISNCPTNTVAVVDRVCEVKVIPLFGTINHHSENIRHLKRP